MNLSEVYLSTMDAYEDFVITKNLLKVLDEAMERAPREILRERSFYVLPQYYAIYAKVWYAEVSWDRQDDALTALRKAAERYEATYSLARGPGVKDILNRQGDVGRHSRRQTRAGGLDSLQLPPGDVQRALDVLRVLDLR